jgi:hypothetical protein
LNQAAGSSSRPTLHVAFDSILIESDEEWAIVLCPKVQAAGASRFFPTSALTAGGKTDKLETTASDEAAEGEGECDGTTKSRD